MFLNFLSFQGQLSILQDKIDHLERLLAENNEIISNIRDSVINLSESVKDGQKNPEAINFSRGSLSRLLPSAPVLLPINKEDCQFASAISSQKSQVQVSHFMFCLFLDNCVFYGCLYVKSMPVLPPNFLLLVNITKTSSVFLF